MDNFNEKQIADLIELGKWKAREIAHNVAQRKMNAYIVKEVVNAYTSTKTASQIREEAIDIRDAVMRLKMVELTGREVL
jgi:hypothetical protein